MRTLELEQQREESGTAAIPVRCHRGGAARHELPAARNVRALVSCWCAYERRWVQATAAAPTCTNGTHERVPASSKQRAAGAIAPHVEAYLVDAGFELEFVNFHALVTHNVASESALERPRRSLETRVREWGAALDHRVRMWWQPQEQDAALASLADLQLVVPGVWIGSALTLQHADAIARKKIAHVVYCATTEPQPQSRIAQLPASPFPSTFAYAITLSETPRQAHLNHMRVAMKSGVAMHSTWHELDAASKFLLGISRLHDKFAAANRFDATSGGSNAYDNNNDSDSSSGDTNERVASVSAEMGLLIYCDSGVSTSVAVCAALLMYRFCLPLELAMLLLRTTRRFVAPSPYLYHQLELYDHALQTRRQGKRLPLQRVPA